MLSTCFRIDARSILTHDYGATKWAFHDHCTACANRAFYDHCATQRTLHDGCAALTTHNGRIARAVAPVASKVMIPRVVTTPRTASRGRRIVSPFPGVSESPSQSRSLVLASWRGDFGPGAQFLSIAPAKHRWRPAVLRFSRTFHRGPDLVNFVKSNRVLLRPPVATLHERP
jgi:hypothetical protein